MFCLLPHTPTLKNGPNSRIRLFKIKSRTLIMELNLGFTVEMVNAQTHRVTGASNSKGRNQPVSTQNI